MIMLMIRSIYIHIRKVHSIEIWQNRSIDSEEDPFTSGGSPIYFRREVIM